MKSVLHLVERVASSARERFGLTLEAPRLLSAGHAEVVRARTVVEGRATEVIVKQFEPRARERFERERTTLKALGALRAPTLVPRLLEADVPTRTLVTEVADGMSLSQILETADLDAAVLALEAVAASLGDLHGRARHLAPEAGLQLAPWDKPGKVLMGGAPRLLMFLTLALGSSVGPGGVVAVERGLEELARRVDASHPLLTVTLGDLAPTNVLHGPGGTVFLDLEYGAVRHAFYDAVFWRVICSFPEWVVARLDTAYVAALARTGVEIDAKQYVAQAALFALHRLFWTLNWDMAGLFTADREFVPGLSARAVLRRYLKDCLPLARPENDLPEPLCRIVLELSKRLAMLWPDAEPTFQFPCFRSTLVPTVPL